jgi:hypothetical protein
MPTWSGGDRVTAAKLSPPTIRMRQTVTQTLTTGVYAAATLTAEDYDTHLIHSTSVNTDQVVIPSGWDGIWKLAAGYAIAPNATGSRGARWTQNGTPFNNCGVMLPNTGAGTAFRGLAAPISPILSAGDIIRLELFQDSGGNLATSVGADVGCWMELTFYRKL